MRTVIFTLGIFIFSILTANAQEMNKGFAFLENGDYLEAKDFFQNILKSYPSNKTAQLCYGRALGLSGATRKARKLFTDLKNSYPEDFEVGLNYAESLLWDADYHAAKSFYKKLIVRDSTNFSALLGYANTLSNLKEYDSALHYVDRALIIQPENRNAALSKKFMALGKANQLTKSFQYDAAIMLLKNSIAVNPDDNQVKAALSNVYLAQKSYDEAHEIYLQISDSLISYVGRSLVAHLQHKDKRALNYAKKSLAFAKADTTRIVTANERFVQALIWNGKYHTAQDNIDKLKTTYPDNKRILALQATLGMYTGRFGKSIKVYQQILEQDSTSFDGNLGIANAYKAQGDLKEAHAYAEKTLDYYPNQKDASALLQVINNTLAPVLDTHAAYTKDNGDNEAFSVGATATLPINSRFKTQFSYNWRTTENKVTNTTADNVSASIGAHYRIHNNTWLEGKVGLVKASATENKFSDINGSIFLKSKPLPLQYLEVGYSRNLQDFNAALIDKKIFMNNFSLNYNLGTNFNFGWYTGIMHTQQTDGNYRNLLFTSIYYNITKRPALKAGINYQYLSFKEQVPTLYFSPSRYQAVELFLDLSGNTGNWSYNINTAAGLQRVVDDESTTLFRAEGRLNYTVTERFQAGLYAKYSNIAAATAAGFEFMEIGINLRWQVLKGRALRN